MVGQGIPEKTRLSDKFTFQRILLSGKVAGIRLFVLLSILGLVTFCFQAWQWQARRPRDTIKKWQVGKVAVISLLTTRGCANVQEGPPICAIPDYYLLLTELPLSRSQRNHSYTSERSSLMSLVPHRTG